MKYKLTENNIKYYNTTLYQIEVVKAFGNLQVGEKGGFIESEKNLSNSGDAQVSGNAQVYGNARVSGNAQVSGQQWVVTGNINKSLKKLGYSLIAQIGVVPSKKILLYKRVYKIKKGKYRSCYDEKFIYEDKKIIKVKNYDKSDKSCAEGIHLSTPLYWDQGDTLIQCEVDFKDIITIQEGKVRCKKCKVIGEIKNGKM